MGTAIRKTCKRNEDSNKIRNDAQTDSGREVRRLVYLDALRLLATVFVIAAHTVSLGASMASPRSAGWYGFEICAWFFLCCNPIFVMISGALLLSVRGETPWGFYKKRLVRVVIPMVVYYILYVCAKEGFRWISPDHWLRLAGRILQGPPKEAPHFWLIYVILGLYVLTPLLRLPLHRIPKKWYGWAAAVILLCLTAYVSLDGLQESRAVSAAVNSFVGVFLLGHILANSCDEKTAYIILTGGAVSVGGAVWMIFNESDFHRYVFNNAPLMVFYAMAVFLIFKKVFGKWIEAPAVLMQASRYSYGVLLIHWGGSPFPGEETAGDLADNAEGNRSDDCAYPVFFVCGGDCS